MIKYGNQAHSAYDHWLMNPKECVFMVEYCNKKHVIEIGSFRGGSAELIAPRCKSLICIDPHEDITWADEVITIGKDVQKEFLECVMINDNVTYIQKYSDNAINDIKNKVDIVFIDGEHSHDQCLKDLQNYTPMCKQYVLIHDYCLMFGGVISACMNYFKRLPDVLIDTLAVYKVK